MKLPIVSSSRQIACLLCHLNVSNIAIDGDLAWIIRFLYQRDILRISLLAVEILKLRSLQKWMRFVRLEWQIVLLIARGPLLQS